jgi:thiazole/oxazole-forming peptide maturase SagD family component
MMPRGETDGRMPDTETYFAKGVHPNPETAISKAVGELLERYFSLLYRQRDFISASIQELRKRKTLFIDPALLSVKFSPEQYHKFPRRTFDETSTFYWVKGISVTRNKPALIPAQLVFWNYKLMPGEPILQQTTTSGNAGHFLLDRAISSALSELIERDGFLRFWLAGKAPPRVDQRSLRTAILRDRIQNVLQYQLQVEIYDVTPDFGEPSFIAAIIDESGLGPPVSLGGGCGHEDSENSIFHAIEEAIMVRHSMRYYYDEYKKYGFPIIEEIMPPIAPRGLAERGHLWSNPEMLNVFQFFRQGPLKPLDRTIKSFQSLPSMVEKLQKKGSAYEVYAYSAQHPLLSKLGYTVVRTIVPGLLPLYLDEQYIPLGIGDTKSIHAVPHPFT